MDLRVPGRRGKGGKRKIKKEKIVSKRGPFILCLSCRWTFVGSRSFRSSTVISHSVQTVEWERRLKLSYFDHHLIFNSLHRDDYSFGTVFHT